MFVFCVDVKLDFFFVVVVVVVVFFGGFWCLFLERLYYNKYDYTSSFEKLMVRWVVGSVLHGVDPLSYLSQCSMTGVTKAVVCAILSVGWCI